MFGHISGNVFDLKPTKAIVESGGIGFVINSTISYIAKLRTGNKASFWTYTAVRENSIDLYGFETERELYIFELLLTVSGIGPKSALSILSVAGTDAVERAAASGDTSFLTKISGIGKKTADRIGIELAGKITVNNKDGSFGEDIDVYEALTALGYKEKDAQEAVRNLPKEITGANDRIKYALKNLGKN